MSLGGRCHKQPRPPTQRRDPPAPRALVGGATLIILTAPSCARPGAGDAERDGVAIISVDDAARAIDDDAAVAADDDAEGRIIIIGGLAVITASWAPGSGSLTAARSHAEQEGPMRAHHR